MQLGSDPPQYEFIGPTPPMGDKDLVRIVFEQIGIRWFEVEVELFRDHAPSFLTFARGIRWMRPQDEIGTVMGKVLTYQNTSVHRLIRGTLLECGDVLHDRGGGGFSKFGKTFTEPQAFGKHKLQQAGLVCMSNRGNGHMSSNFFVILRERGLPRLSDRYVCIGRITSGLQELLEFSSDKANKTTEEDEPIIPIKLVSLKILSVKEKFPPIPIVELPQL